MAYPPIEFATETKTEQDRQAREHLAKYGDHPRRFRNGLGLAIPEKKQIEARFSQPASMSGSWNFSPAWERHGFTDR